ncbi:MAG: hypothetical protein F6J93_38485 [Oscillatoria sp. SIO1A7]|nr:hypothetical protein [Oscillatoria sp. SIO1A7]
MKILRVNTLPHTPHPTPHTLVSGRRPQSRHFIHLHKNLQKYHLKIWLKC